MTRPAEVWRPIPTTEGLYEASSKGRIRSLHTRSGGRVISPGKAPHGGYVFTARRHGRSYSMTVCRAVALAFLGEPEDPRAEARHISMDLTDDRPSNLHWVVK